MTKFERIFYFLIIIVLFSLMLYKRIAAPVEKNNSQVQQFYSFYGVNIEGKKKLIHFSAYSPHNYIFCTISNDCHHCQIFKKKLTKFLLNNKINENTQFILLTESIENIKLDIHSPFHFLEIKRDDFIQFGFNTPTIFAVNGQGNILFRHSGYYPGIFDIALAALEI